MLKSLNSFSICPVFLLTESWDQLSLITAIEKAGNAEHENNNNRFAGPRELTRLCKTFC